MSLSELVAEKLRQARSLLGTGEAPERAQLEPSPEVRQRLPRTWAGTASDSAAQNAAFLAGAQERLNRAQTQAIDTISATASIGQSASHHIDAIQAGWRSDTAALTAQRGTLEYPSALLQSGQQRLEEVTGVLNGAVTRYGQAAQAIRAAQNELPPAAEPQAYVDPQKPGTPTRWVPCWIGSARADISTVCPIGTTDVYWMDKDGYWHKNIATGKVELYDPIGPNTEAPEICYLPSADADRSICGPKTTQWQYPGPDGSLITEIQQVPGTGIRVITQPPGPMGPEHVIVTNPGPSQRKTTK